MAAIQHPFAELIGLVFSEMGEGSSVCEAEATVQLYNPRGTIHGGVLYSLADTGMGGALSSLLAEGESCSTIEIKITYFRPVTAGKLICRSKVIHRGRRIAALESDILINENPVAKAGGTFFVFKKK